VRAQRAEVPPARAPSAGEASNPAKQQVRPLPCGGSSRCPRCGAPLVALDGLAEAARRAHEALLRMRLAVPHDVATGLRLLASTLPCHAGTCTRSAA
jgi:hypothetical protein